jgi:hypothetical protein
MNYSELLTNVRNYTEVGSEVLSDSIIDIFIENVENKIQRELDLDAFRKFQFSSFTIGSPFITVPDDFAFERGVQIKDQVTNNRTWLEQRDTTFIDEYNVNRSDTGKPKYYANWDQNTIMVAPTPDLAYEIELWYNKTPDHLSSSNTTTWLSTNAPEVFNLWHNSRSFFLLEKSSICAIIRTKVCSGSAKFSTNSNGQKT